jgi:hypothetical protein
MMENKGEGIELKRIMHDDWRRKRAALCDLRCVCGYTNCLFRSSLFLTQHSKHRAERLFQLRNILDKFSRSSEFMSRCGF